MRIIYIHVLGMRRKSREGNMNLFMMLTTSRKIDKDQ